MIDWQLSIPGVELRSLNRDLRGTTTGARMAAADRAKNQRTGVTTMCWARFGVPPRGKNNEPVPLVITITRVGPRELDTDNLAASAKHVRDGISDWLGVNDRSKLLKWEYSQARGIYGEYGVEVHVQTWRQTFEEVLACSTEYQAAHKKSLKAAEARARLEPGTSRARVTTANARWASAAEARDRIETRLRREWEGSAA